MTGPAEALARSLVDAFNTNDAELISTIVSPDVDFFGPLGRGDRDKLVSDINYFWGKGLRITGTDWTVNSDGQVVTSDVVWSNAENGAELAGRLTVRTSPDLGVISSIRERHPPANPGCGGII